MVETVNVVGSGSLDSEFNLNTVTNDIGSIAEYNSEVYPGMYLRFSEEAPLVTLYRTGKFIVTGADSEDEAHRTRQRFLNLLVDGGMIEPADDEGFEIQNLVCIAELNQSLNLKTVAINLGLEDAEYEPEQFPGLIYRPSEAASVVLLFASGRVVITGASDLNSAERTFETLKNRMKDLHIVE